MTPETRERLREMLAAAAPGPWRGSHGIYFGDSGFVLDGSVRKHADADLIVAMRNALPSLLSELDALEAWKAGAEVGADELRKENERLLGLIRKHDRECTPECYAIEDAALAPKESK